MAAGSLSFVSHVTGILAAMYLTAHAGQPRRAVQADTTMVFLSSPKSVARERETRESETRRTLAVNVSLKGFQTIVAVTEIPVSLPPVDFAERFDPRDYSGIGAEGGTALGFEPPPNAEVVYLEAVVHEPPERLAGPIPAYPPLMRLAETEGTVSLEFVVDTLGSVERGSTRVVSSPNSAFSESALLAIGETLFRPGRVNGRAVRVLVRLPFTFVIQKAPRD